MPIEDFEEQVKDTEPDPWEGQIFTLADAYKPRPPVRYVIGGLFPEGSLSIVYGPPGSLKSMLLGDAGMAAAFGGQWLGRDVAQGPALWIDLDNGKRRTHERVEALGRGHGADEGAPFYYVSMPTPWLNAGKLADIEALERRIKTLGAKLVIIDNLGLIAPSADENSDDMILVMSHLRQLAERTGAAIVVIHHQRKGNGSGSRAGESLRGHSSIESAVDLALLVERDVDSDIIRIRSTKSRDCLVPPFGAEFRYEHRPGTTELMEALFWKVGFKDTTSDRALKKAVVSILREQSPLTQNELINRAKSVWQGGEKRIREILKSMVQKKEIKISDGPHNAKLYSVE